MPNFPKTVVVTGVSSGIGHATATRLLQKGYRVFGSVRTRAEADRLQAEWGSSFTPLLFDVTDGAAVHAAVAELSTHLAGSGLGALINNAGIAVAGPLQLQPLEVIRQHFEVNVIGLLRVTQALLPLLGARPNHPVPPGRIINISSVGGEIAGPFIGAYHGTKFALEGLSHTLRRELQLYGIDVAVVGPGSVNTPIWDKGADVGPYAQTPYGPAMKAYLEYTIEQGRKGYPPAYLGAQVVDILEKAHPRTRYALVPGRFQNWILPRLLPARVLDRLVGKNTGLLSK